MGSVLSQEPLKAKKLDRSVIETGKEGGQEENETLREVENCEIGKSKRSNRTIGRVYKLHDTVEIESIKISMKEKNALF